MKKLSTLAELAQEISLSINQIELAEAVPVLEKSQHTHVTAVAVLRKLVATLQRKVQLLERPPLTREERTEVVLTIMAGLLSFPHQQAAKTATRTYNTEWFNAEPDPELKKMLSASLIERYGKSGFANIELWSNYA